MHFSLHNVCSPVSIPACHSLLHARLLSSYRFSLASPFLFYFWLSVSVRSRGNLGTRGPSKDASRFPAPLTGRYLRLPSQCLLRLSPSCPPSSFSFTFILHGITSGDDGIPESKTRSFEFVEILKDVVDLLSSTVLQLPRFQTVQPSLPPSSIDSPISYRWSLYSRGCSS